MHDLQTAAPAPPRRRPGLDPGPFVAAGLLIPIIVVYLWFPGDADQTLFELVAARLSNGAVYYRDIWDIKQPGIYWVYQLGAAVGLGVMGPRLLEIAAASLGGWLAWRLAGRWGVHRVAQVLAPAAVSGTYLLHTQHGGVVVIEGLTTPLLVAVLDLAWPHDPSGGPPTAPARWMAAGLLTGVIGVLKTMYVPLPAVILLGALVASRTDPGRRLRLGSLAVLGAALPLGATSAYFAAHGVWRLFWVTTVVIPLRTAGQPVMSANRHQYLEIAVGLGSLLLPLAVIAVSSARRRGTVVREATLAGTAVLALALAWPQFPTPYRLLILVAPLGLLAIVGCDVVLRRAQTRAALLAVLAVLALLAVPSMRGPQRLLFAATTISSWGLDRTSQLARDEVLIHESASADVAPVRGLIAPGDSVYVIGHPQPYPLLGVREAIEVVGWGAALQPAVVWEERDRELTRSRPRWVFVETDMRPVVARLAPDFSRVLAAQYRPVATTPRGVWFHTGTPGTVSGVPGDNRLDPH